MNYDMTPEYLVSMQFGNDDIFDKNRYAAAAAIAASKQTLMSALNSMKHTQGGHVMIADLGCGDGGHTFSTVDTVVEVLRRNLAAINGGTEPVFDVTFSDLPRPNVLIKRAFRQFENRVNGSGKKYYVAGTSYPLYSRLFRDGELHVGVTTNALQWLYQVPRKVMEKGSKTWNKGRVWIEGADEKEVVEAYADQADKDLGRFLYYRRQEIKVGGMLFMLMAGRPSGLETQVSDDSRLKLIFSTLMDQTWQDLVDEGSIDEDTRDAFNIPLYLRNPEEVASAIESCGGFKIEKMELLKVADPLNARQQKFEQYLGQIKTMFEEYLSPDLASKFYERYAIRAATNIEFRTKYCCFYYVIAVSAIRV